jgi:hypothetical protein
MLIYTIPVYTLASKDAIMKKCNTEIMLAAKLARKLRS